MLFAHGLPRFCRIFRLTAPLAAFLLSASSAFADCHMVPYEMICDIYSEADFRAAAQWSTSLEVLATLHANVTLASAASVPGTMVVDGNGFSLSGQLLGHGTFDFISFSASP